ncbi:MAG: hypothetical protein ACHRHE_14345 [Tepidisphaerales bacterium]
MGLDAVELFMNCEEAFGISIPDEAALKVVTVGDLYDLIMKLTAERSEGPTHTSSAAFYRLRQGLVACGQDRDHILPTSRLEDLLPAQQRKVLWEQLAKATGIRLPPLRRPEWVPWLNCACAAVAAVAAWAISRRFLFGFIAAGGAALLAHTFTAALCTVFPKSCHTLEDLVFALIGRRENTLVPATPPGPQETWNRLRQIIAETLGVREDEVRPHTRFAEDLNWS